MARRIWDYLIPISRLIYVSSMAYGNGDVNQHMIEANW